jgi:hypothetical protein
MTAEQLAKSTLELATIAAPIYARYLTFPMKRVEALELAAKDALALSGAVLAELQERLTK